MGERVRIEPRNLHWLPGGPAAQDLCVHGGAIVRIDDELVVDDSAEEWALSAGAVFLLRTLDRDHTPEHPVAEHLLPHCGHAMYVDSESPDVVIVGCPHGRNWCVVHAGDQVVLGFDDGRQYRVPVEGWRNGVLEFSDAIEQFYSASEPKEPSDADAAAGFEAFLSEWKRRIGTARHAA
jgi:hypothetical protein